MRTPPKRAGRRPERARRALSRDRILRAAMRLVDRAGVEALSMRRLARALGVEAMSLYRHVADKDAVLDGLVDLVAGEIGMPEADADWRTALRRHATATRAVCLRHRWAAQLLERRGGRSDTRMRYADAILGLLRRAGFTVPAAYRAFLLIDSYLYGFLMQEAAWPSDEGELAELAAFLTSPPADLGYPSLVEAMRYIQAANAPGRRLYEAEFEHGLSLILDGLERVRQGADGG